MAQNEGRTLRRAPKSFLSHLTLFIVMLVLSLAFGLVVHELKAAAESALTVETSPRGTPETNQGTAAGIDASTAGSKTIDGQAAVPSCTPANYKLPTPIDVSGLPTGVTTVEDSVQQYTVYGNTAAQRLQQLQHCAPAGEYAGAASYQVTWQYAYSFRPDGLCQIVQPKIGLHLTMILPEWSPGIEASLTEQATWKAYIRALTTHEQGHYSISKQYARMMLTGLQQLPVQSCDSIKIATDTFLESKLAQLKIAQENYDAATDHGATQGAVL